MTAAATFFAMAERTARRREAERGRRMRMRHISSFAEGSPWA
jgi:hypothetical protein